LFIDEEINGVGKMGARCHLEYVIGKPVGKRLNHKVNLQQQKFFLPTFSRGRNPAGIQTCGYEFHAKQRMTS